MKMKMRRVGVTEPRREKGMDAFLSLLFFFLFLFFAILSSNTILSFDTLILAIPVWTGPGGAVYW